MIIDSRSFFTGFACSTTTLAPIKTQNIENKARRACARAAPPTQRRMSPARARPAPDECFLPRSSQQQQQQQRCIAGLAPGCAPLVGEGCPGDSWFDELAQRFPIKSPVMINVGANKGYAVADFVARHDQSRGVSVRAWHRAILNASAIMQSGNLDHLSCGVRPGARGRLQARIIVREQH